MHKKFKFQKIRDLQFTLKVAHCQLKMFYFGGSEKGRVIQVKNTSNIQILLYSRCSSVHRYRRSEYFTIEAPKKLHVDFFCDLGLNEDNIDM